MPIPTPCRPGLLCPPHHLPTALLFGEGDGRGGGEGERELLEVWQGTAGGEEGWDGEEVEEGTEEEEGQDAQDAEGGFGHCGD
eukprot:CAMPEP_0168328298 /NCGR_PEP_ID=MMETSP0213-20121227/6405_1 /TAXON_ID=151035 /ORGANISM="Euplotes harpa, Strain FSP1.4" /LENGTH=82 /DNA_ID=CAMNT_0008331357 /DNA_START=80 /DNA_END=328 /DNA_ORIENTATION=+